MRRRPPLPRPARPPPWPTCRTPRIHGRPSRGGAPCSLPSGQGRSFPVAWSALLEEVDELPIAARDPGGSLVARRLSGVPGDQWIPENGAANSKADEARHLGRHAEPFADLAIVLAAAEHDAA